MLAVAVRVEADWAAELEHTPEASLALAQRHAPQVLAGVAREVEEVEEHGHALAATALKPGEARDAVLEGHDLAVGDEVVGRLPLERLDDRGVLVVHPAACPRDELDA